MVVSHHGREKKLPRPWEGKDSGTFAQLYRHTNQTIQVYLLNYTGILTQLYRHTYSTVQAYECNYTDILTQLYRHTNATI
ncbi:MAG: hypothetical protein E6834_10780, partial [Bacteroides ovatus]|nr:hypothetical protein [Bacteroides ovatus]